MQELGNEYKTLWSADNLIRIMDSDYVRGLAAMTAVGVGVVAAAFCCLKKPVRATINYCRNAEPEFSSSTPQGNGFHSIPANQAPDNSQHLL